MTSLVRKGGHRGPHAAGMGKYDSSRLKENYEGYSNLNTVSVNDALTRPD